MFTCNQWSRYKYIHNIYIIYTDILNLHIPIYRYIVSVYTLCTDILSVYAYSCTPQLPAAALRSTYFRIPWSLCCVGVGGNVSNSIYVYVICVCYMYNNPTPRRSFNDV
ncbi:hypothetical protein B484DRAFT_104197 [Ochromonadaceae sp. CCMP2298]|nr:hypothetical protein B484DRAFT_104197 [Ochromonadaceae sp. CCMP2298]